MMFEAYKNKHTVKNIVTESVETDAAVIAKTEDPGHDGPKVTSKDQKAADYIANKRKEIELSINKEKQRAEEEESARQETLHSDALYIWDYLIHKKKHSPQDAMKIVNMAKIAFEHLV